MSYFLDTMPTKSHQGSSRPPLFRAGLIRAFTVLPPSPSHPKAQELRVQKEMQLEQDERMARAMEAIKLDEQRDRLMRQQIRENSTEIRELVAKLKAGYMNRERRAQIAEKEAMKCEKTVRGAVTRRARLERLKACRINSAQLHPSIHCHTCAPAFFIL